MTTPALDHRMRARAASSLYLDRPPAPRPGAPLTPCARRRARAPLVAYMEERLSLIPRYCQRVVEVPLNIGHPTWETDPEFDIYDHVIRHHLRGGGDDETLARLCAKLFAEPLDRARPLWELHIIDGYGAGSALLSKTHQCMADGPHGVQITNVLMDPSPRPAPLPARALPHADAISHPLLRTAEAVVDTVWTQLGALSGAARFLSRPARALEEVRAALDAVGSLSRTVAESPAPMPFNGEIGRDRTIAWARLSLNETRAIKSRLGGTVNDVVLSVICGGLRHYLIACGVNVESAELKAMVPVSLHTDHQHGRLGHRVSMMVAPLPVGCKDPIERLRQISATMDLLKNSGQDRPIRHLVALTDLLPPLLQVPLARLQATMLPVNTVCTNVPGPRETRYLLGEPVHSMVPLVPLAAGVGLGFAILSYADQLTIGINADAGRVANAWRVQSALRRAFEELWEATGLERVVEAPAVDSALKRRARMRPPRRREA